MRQNVCHCINYVHIFRFFIFYIHNESKFIIMRIHILNNRHTLKHNTTQQKKITFLEFFIL